MYVHVYCGNNDFGVHDATAKIPLYFLPLQTEHTKKVDTMHLIRENLTFYQNGRP